MRGTAGLFTPERVARAVRRRISTRVHPQLYRLRGRVPRWNLHEQARRFYQRADELGLGDLRRYAWYHTVDLGRGLVTPGTYDHRRSLPAFRFPADMRGMNVLDVGSATGFFAFEFERRGANVVSVEVPSIDGYDRFPFENGQQTLEKLAYMARDQSAYDDADYGRVFDEPSPDDVYH
jgi:hypothetical protein